MYRKHSFTFEAGKHVRFYDNDFLHRHLVGKSFLVTKTMDVPEDQIEYNPFSLEGGVGHHQWLVIDGNVYSGAWFQPFQE